MDLSRELPPPSFYLSTIKTGKLWLFTDVPVFPESYRSSMTVQALPGMNTPLVTQGYGNGRVWSFQAKLNAWNKFLSEDGGTSGRDPGRTVYQDYLDIIQFIEENGPSPLLLLHMPGRNLTTVALEGFDSEIALQEDTSAFDGQLPSTIPVSLSLREVVEYTVVFS